MMQTSSAPTRRAGMSQGNVKKPECFEALEVGRGKRERRKWDAAGA